MYAIVEISGKQYRVEKDITLSVDKLKEKGDTITLDKVLMFVDGKDVMLGQPYLANVKVTATNIGLMKGKKVRGIKFKKRKNYTRTLGYRHEYLQIKIDELSVK